MIEVYFNHTIVTGSIASMLNVWLNSIYPVLILTRGIFSECSLKSGNSVPCFPCFSMLFKAMKMRSYHASHAFPCCLKL